MPHRFECSPALWFRVPLRAVTLVVVALGLYVIAPALGEAATRDRAIAGLAVVVLFAAASSVVTAAVADSYAEIEGDTLLVRFEGMFFAAYPLRDITMVQRIDPRRRWRHSLGLSTDWHERLVLSHGGELVEIQFRRPQPARLLRRTVPVRRLWIAVSEPDAFIEALNRAARWSEPAAA